MAKLKTGEQFDIKTGEILESQTIPSERRVEITTSYGKKRVRVRLFNNEPSMTDASQAEFTDINYIMKGRDLRDYAKLPEHAKAIVDLTNFSDLHGAYQAIQDAEHAFSQMPAKLRSQFDNDPRKLHAFLSDPKNNEEAIFLGLKEKPSESFSDYRTRISQGSNDGVVEQSKPKGAQGSKTKQQQLPKSDDSSDT